MPRLVASKSLRRLALEGGDERNRGRDAESARGGEHRPWKSCLEREVGPVKSVPAEWGPLR